MTEATDQIKSQARMSVQLQRQREDRYDLDGFAEGTGNQRRDIQLRMLRAASVHPQQGGGAPRSTVMPSPTEPVPVIRRQSDPTGVPVVQSSLINATKQLSSRSTLKTNSTQSQSRTSTPSRLGISPSVPEDSISLESIPRLRDRRNGAGEPVLPGGQTHLKPSQVPTQRKELRPTTEFRTPPGGNGANTQPSSASPAATRPQASNFGSTNPRNHQNISNAGVQQRDKAPLISQTANPNQIDPPRRKNRTLAPQQPALTTAGPQAPTRTIEHPPQLRTSQTAGVQNQKPAIITPQAPGLGRTGQHSALATQGLKLKQQSLGAETPCGTRSIGQSRPSGPVLGRVNQSSDARALGTGAHQRGPRPGGLVSGNIGLVPRRLTRASPDIGLGASALNQPSYNVNAGEIRNAGMIRPAIRPQSQRLSFHAPIRDIAGMRNIPLRRQMDSELRNGSPHTSFRSGIHPPQSKTYSGYTPMHPHRHHSIERQPQVRNGGHHPQRHPPHRMIIEKGKERHHHHLGETKGTKGDSPEPPEPHPTQPVPPISPTPPPETPRSENSRPENPQPENSQSEDPRPENPQPGTTPADDHQPETVQLDNPQPETIQSDMSQPENVQPEVPQSKSLDAAIPQPEPPQTGPAGPMPTEPESPHAKAPPDADHPTEPEEHHKQDLEPQQTSQEQNSVDDVESRADHSLAQTPVETHIKQDHNHNYHNDAEDTTHARPSKDPNNVHQSHDMAMLGAGVGAGIGAATGLDEVLSSSSSNVGDSEAKETDVANEEAQDNLLNLSDAKVVERASSRDPPQDQTDYNDMVPEDDMHEHQDQAQRLLAHDDQDSLRSDDLYDPSGQTQSNDGAGDHDDQASTNENRASTPQAEDPIDGRRGALSPEDMAADESRTSYGELDDFPANPLLSEDNYRELEEHDDGFEDPLASSHLSEDGEDDVRDVIDDFDNFFANEVFNGQQPEHNFEDSGKDRNDEEHEDYDTSLANFDLHDEENAGSFEPHDVGEDEVRNFDNTEEPINNFDQSPAEDAYLDNQSAHFNNDEAEDRHESETVDHDEGTANKYDDGHLEEDEVDHDQGEDQAEDYEEDQAEEYEKDQVDEDEGDQTDEHEQEDVDNYEQEETDNHEEDQVDETGQGEGDYYDQDEADNYDQEQADEKDQEDDYEDQENDYENQDFDDFDDDNYEEEQVDDYYNEPMDDYDGHAMDDVDGADDYGDSYEGDMGDDDGDTVDYGGDTGYVENDDGGYQQYE